jgi:peroxiredoxin
MSRKSSMIKIGDPAPNFSLKDQNDRTFDLLEHTGVRVLLSFHPLAWTSACARQVQSLETNREKFESLHVVAVGISVDSVPCKRAWAESIEIFNTRLLSDFWPHGKVAQQYGVFRDANGFSERSNILLDENLKVVFTKVYPIHSIPDLEEVVGFLRTM